LQCLVHRQSARRRVRGGRRRVKTNLVFLTKGEPTEKIWYYDLSDVKASEKKAADDQPL
jgi:type I restriction enzyme M protein